MRAFMEEYCGANKKEDGVLGSKECSSIMNEETQDYPWIKMPRKSEKHANKEVQPS